MKTVILAVAIATLIIDSKTIVRALSREIWLQGETQIQ